ncbi:MAG TPA: aconitate hydratase AcnA [Gammaproteobacteria bacterium]|nr:aconitate hydratase AcnA [Gammaproteobacteria bacterium]
MLDSFGSKQNITVDQKSYTLFNLNSLAKSFDVGRLPYSMKILLENLLRHENNDTVTKQDIKAILNWKPQADPDYEIAFTPARVLLQDFTGVPAIVDLAAMRDAMVDLGGDPNKINPLSQVDLVIDHSVMVDVYGSADALEKNTSIEISRNRERYAFLRWGQQSLSNFRVVPPGTGIVHQVNLEYLAKVIFTQNNADGVYAFPDTVIGTDSHTPMINGLGVLGWGVGGIEAEAAMLGQPVTMFIPQVVGFELTGKLSQTATATDLVLTVTEMLRKKGVVGKFVEFFGDGIEHLTIADRATISNMSPEYGATCGIFPIDQETLKYLRLTGRDEHNVKLIETYAKAQGMFHTPGDRVAEYSDRLSLDLATVEACIAGPKRPQDRIPITKAKEDLHADMLELKKDLTKGVEVVVDKQKMELKNGSVAIAAITSCTNTSNPDVMVAAALMAQKANALGLKSKPWVKTSLAPGSKVVTEYLESAGLLKALDRLGFFIVGYGCTTCIGNSGPLKPEISKAINENSLVVAAVLSGNRNFEGRIHPDVQSSYLGSPPLVVAYALAGTIDFDFSKEPLGNSSDGKQVFLRDIWPTKDEIAEVVSKHLQAKMFTDKYKSVFAGNEEWVSLPATKSEQFAWDPKSTYVRKPPYFAGMHKKVDPIRNVKDARVLVMLGDSVTTDHISPAGAINANSSAAKYLIDHGVDPKDFNSYGSRRGNHEVMMRATFANMRLKNLLLPGTIGAFTVYFPTNTQMTIFDAAMKYINDGTQQIILAGKEYGAGSSRDWAAKGPKLLGIDAVIAESFERIHRSNLIGMGILPLRFKDGESIEKLELKGNEKYSIDLNNLRPLQEVTVTVSSEGAVNKTFKAISCIYTPKEFEYFANGGILQYVLRRLAG